MKVIMPEIREFAERYTAAWCSHDPTRVASFFSPRGSLRINDSAPAVGREEITAAARGFMTAFPDLKVEMDGLEEAGERTIYRWTLTGTFRGPGGIGQCVHVSGFEEWLLGPDGLVVDSRGHFDETAYEQQLRAGH